MVLVRSRTDRVLTGVAGGVGERLGVDPWLVRVGFLLLSIAGGAGVALYAGLWIVSAEPRPGAGEPPPAQEPDLRRPVALGLVVLGLLLVFRSLGLWFGDALAWPLALAAVGSALVWSRGGPAERERGARAPSNLVQALVGGRWSLARLAAGGLLVTLGMLLFLAANDVQLVLDGDVLVAMGVATVGLGLILGPWSLRLVRQVNEERRERIRSEERAELAAHLHDSVLHTLALIQRSGAPPEVRTLARSQERELRAWLYGQAAPSAEAKDLRAALEAMAERVERLHNVPVEVVVVGEGLMDDRTRALVQATQEAAVNAARHSRAGKVSVYVEIEPGEVNAFVHDEGVGFDPATVPPDRRGIAESILGRMQRHGGTATVTSAPGEGTEVHLRMPREAP